MSEGIELIKREIIRKAKEEAESIILKAKEEASKIIIEAGKKAKEMQMKEAKPEIDMRKRRTLGSASLEARNLLIQTKEEVFSEVFEIAKERLKYVAERKNERFDYDEILFSLIKEAAQNLEEGEINIATNERDQRILKERLNFIEERLRKELGYDIKLKLADETHACIGGIVAYNSDRTKIFYNTFEGRLASLYKTLKLKLNEILFK